MAGIPDDAAASFERPASLTDKTQARAAWAARLAALTIAGIVTYVVMVVIAQVRPPHYDVIKTAESDLAIGRYGWIMTSAFVVRGALSLALVAVLALVTRGVARSRLGLWLIGLWGAGALLLAVFPTDLPGATRTVHGGIHALVAVAAFFAAGLGELLVSRRIAALDGWPAFARRAQRLALAALVVCVLAVAALGLSATTHGGLAGVAGLLERVFLGLVLLWMLLVAVRVSSHGRAVTGGVRRAAMEAVLDRRPIAWAAGLAGLWMAVTITGAVVLRATAPGISRTSQSLIVLGLLATMVAAGLAALGWWRVVGFNARSRWRDLRLLWLPAVLVVLPLVGGVRAVAPGALAIFVIGYALTGFAEEAFARGILLRVLRSRSVLSAVLVSSLLFGVMHLSNVMFRSSPALVVAQAIGAACFGVGFAALRLRTGTIWPLLVLHMLTDLFGQLARLPAIPFFVAQDIVLIGYGLYLVRGPRARQIVEESDATDATTSDAAPLREAA
ncbi:MAG: DUF998 domain-containing protein [Actinomycetes bacterium]